MRWLAAAGLGVMLLACEARVTPDDSESEPEPQPEPGCDDRITGDGEWIRPIGLAAESTHGFDLDSAADGSIVVGTALEGDAIFDCVELSPVGGSDVVVMKLDAAGAVEWARRVGEPGLQLWAPRVEGLDDGSVQLFAMSLDEELMEVAVHFVRFSPAGDLAWWRSFSKPFVGYTEVEDAAVGPGGTSHAAVTFEGNWEIGGATYDGGFGGLGGSLLITLDDTGELGGIDFFETHYVAEIEIASDGTLARRDYGGSVGTRTVVVENGRTSWEHDEPVRPTPMHISDRRSDSNNLGARLIDGVRPEAGDGPWLRARDLASGALLWASPVSLQWEGTPGSSPPHVERVAEVPGGWIVTAALQGRMNLGSGWIESAGGVDGVLAMHGPQGEPISARAIGGPGLNVIRDVVALPNGSVAVAIASDEAIDLGFGSAGTPYNGHCCQHFLALIQPPGS